MFVLGQAGSSVREQFRGMCGNTENILIHSGDFTQSGTSASEQAISTDSCGVKEPVQRRLSEM